MEQFSLEEYLKNPTRKVVTREGRDVRIICTDVHNSLPIVALIKDGDMETVALYYSTGKFPEGSNRNDLFFALKNKSVWVFLYKSDATHIVSFTCMDKVYAEHKMNECNGFSLTEITWEE